MKFSCRVGGDALLLFVERGRSRRAVEIAAASLPANSTISGVKLTAAR